MNRLDDQYLDLLRKILRDGKIKTDRTGTGTQSIFGYQIRHNMADGFPLLTTKKVHFKGIVTELLWFLRGDTNIKYLVDNGCNIWNGDAYKAFKKERREIHDKIVKEHPECDFQPWDETVSAEEFAEKIKNEEGFSEKWGDLGPIYGKQWRDWVNVTHGETERMSPYTINNHHDQISTLIHDLRNNPDSRRLMVNAWNVGEIEHMVLPPCHYGFQCYTTELTPEERFDWYFENKKPNRDCVDAYDELCEMDRLDLLDNSNVPKRSLSLMWNQRSVDTPLGLPFNIASYGLLLILLAKHVNMIPDQLIGNFGDTHIYLNQIDGVKEQLTRPSFTLPTVKIKDREVDDISEYKPEDFELVGYVSGPKINYPLSN